MRALGLKKKSDYRRPTRRRAGLMHLQGGFAAPPLLAEAGLPVDVVGRALVTPTLQVRDHPAIVVAGDSAAAGDGGQTIRMGCVSAMPMGAHAGSRRRGDAPGSPGFHRS